MAASEEVTPDGALRPFHRITKAFHRKSRTGCQTCRTRRVKCDERRPVCRNCESRNVTCAFGVAPNEPLVTCPLPTPPEDSNPTTITRPATEVHVESGRATSTTTFPNIADIENVLDLPESKARRMLELRLMNHWAEYLAKPFPEVANSHLVTAWGEHVPRMALRYDNVLSMMFACSACHLLRSEPEDSELAIAADVYLGLALREQHTAVAKLAVENADSVCFAGMLLLITSVARLWKRQLEPYTPPMEWLRLGTGAGTVLRTAKELLKQDTSSKMWMFINAPPVFDVKVLFDKANMEPFCKILEPEIGGLDQETREVYEKTLSFVGYVHRSVDEDEPIYIVARKIISFAIFVPRRFVELVEEKRPRALLILAHYFALMARYPSVWWIGKTPKREIQGIRDVLPHEYQELMRWPSMMAGLKLS